MSYIGYATNRPQYRATSEVLKPVIALFLAGLCFVALLLITAATPSELSQPDEMVLVGP